MTQESHLTKESHPSTGTRNERLGSYLTAVVGAGALTATSEAAIVNLDLSAFAGPNAGLPSPGGVLVDLSTLDARLVGNIYLLNSAPADGDHLWTGLLATNMSISYDSGQLASPRNFSTGAYIIEGISAYFGEPLQALFRVEDLGDWDGESWSGGSIYNSPDFGPGSFLGFRSNNGHYGWLEVTWDSTTQVFELLGGAFEDVAGVGIEAGAVAAVPEPSGVLGTMGVLAAGAFVRRRRRPA